MSLGNIIGNLLNQGTSSQSHNRLRTGAENVERSGGIYRMLGSLMRGSGTSGRDGKEQAGGMTGAKIGGLSAASANEMALRDCATPAGGAMLIRAIRRRRPPLARSSIVKQQFDPKIRK
jgi:hypothetical protein